MTNDECQNLGDDVCGGCSASVIRHFFLIAALFLLSGCAGDFIAKPVDPLRPAAKKFAANVRVSAGRSPAETKTDALLLAGALAQRDGQSDPAILLYLRALDELSRRPPDPAALEAHRFVTSRLIELCAPRLLAAGARPLEFTANDSPQPARRYRVVLRRGPGDGGVEPSRFAALRPTDRYTVSGVSVMSGRPGAGAPLVGDLKPLAPLQTDVGPGQSISGLTWAVTAVAHTRPARGAATQEVALELYEPHNVETVARQPLAADYTTPLAVSHSEVKDRKFGLVGFTSGDRYFANAGLYSLQLPTPGKTPIVLVHGLLSDPGAFRYLFNTLESDPEICRHYQLWLFFYPTSLPVPAAAGLLRESLAKKVRELDPAGRRPELRRVVLVGHSMGGLVSRLVSSDSNGDAFYRHYFHGPVDRLEMAEAERGKLRRALFFRREPDVRTTIFIATPHRGSSLAVSPIGFLGRLLVKLPGLMKKNLQSLAANNPTALASPDLARESSIFGLNPRNPLVQAMADAPLAADQVRFYSIIGNRGRGGPLERSSDGIVPYTSSHLPQAVHETVVPAGHTGTLIVPQSLEEVARILRERAGVNPSPPAQTERTRAAAEAAR